LLICRSEGWGIAEAVAGWLAGTVSCIARVAAYTRDGLRPVESAPTQAL
jgi:hypothetical protein